MRNIVVIGSGPSGSAASLVLLELGWNVIMIDIDSEAESQNSDSNYSSPSLKSLKKIANKDYPYDINQFLQLKGPAKNWFTSKAKGGFSLVWGATWSRNENLEDESWITAKKKVDQLMGSFINSENSRFAEGNQTCTCFDDILTKSANGPSSENLSLGFSSMAVNNDRCDLSGECHDFCKKKAIWSSLEFLKKCAEYPNFHYRSNFFVERVQHFPDKVRVNSAEEFIESDYCLLGAGPIGNSAILIKSNITDEVSLRDTQMITVPILRIKAKKQHKGAFGLSGMTMDGVTGNMKFHMQFYGHPETFLERILEKFPDWTHKLLRMFFKPLSKFLYVSILYLDSMASGEIKLQQGVPLKYGFEMQPNYDLLQKKIKRYISKSIRNLSMFPLWKLAEHAGVGDSYHMGAARGVQMDGVGRLTDYKRIGMLGSFALPQIEPGPITYMAMTQSVLLAFSLNDD